jgi:hypothetical protein
MMVATFANMERHISLCLQAEAEKISTSSVTQLSPHLSRYGLIKFRFHQQITA